VELDRLTGVRGGLLGVVTTNGRKKWKRSGVCGNTCDKSVGTQKKCRCMNTRGDPQFTCRNKRNVLYIRDRAL